MASWEPLSVALGSTAYSELIHAAVGYCRLHDPHFMQYTEVMAIQYNTIQYVHHPQW